MLFCGFVDRFPKLRLLDFRKIRQKERAAAVELFKSKKGKEILKEIAKTAKAAPHNGTAADAPNSKGKIFPSRDYGRNHPIASLHFSQTVPTASPADIQRIREAIKNATSLSEVERLTRILQSGNIPEDISEQNGNGELIQLLSRPRSKYLISESRISCHFQVIQNKRWILHRKLHGTRGNMEASKIKMKNEHFKEVLFLLLN